MIDIHTHIIFGVDDGAKSLEESLTIIQNEIALGITDIICTPHYKVGMFDATYEQCYKNFNILSNEVRKRNLPVNLYLGREVYYKKSIDYLFNNKEQFSINNTNTILLEFSYTIDPDIEEVLYQLRRKGIKVIIAHIERYNYINNIEEVIGFKSMGALIQVNASTIIGKSGRKQKRRILKLIKLGLVDFISSDIHYSRVNYMKEAYEIINKKFGKIIADKLFNDNAKRLISVEEEIVA